MAVPLFTTLLSSNGTNADQSSYTTASLAPTASRLVLAMVLSQSVSGTPNSPTLSGGGVSTWTEVDNILLSSRRMTVFRALTGGSPTSGSVTIDFAAQTQTSCIWQFVEIEDCLLSGTNGADAVVQSDDYSNTSGVALTLTLPGAWAGIDNRGIAFYFCAGTSVTFTSDASYAELSYHSISGISHTAFHGRDGSGVDLSGTASAGGVKLAMGIEIAGAVDVPADPVTFQYSRLSRNPLRGGLS
jgi:hypothetical protein